MSIELGYLLRVDVEGKPSVYHGEISFDGYDGEVFLVPAVKASDKSPDYTVKLKIADAWQERGGAWRRPLKKGGFLLSLGIDGPEFRQGLNAAAFPDDEQPRETPKNNPATFTIKWSRAKPQAAAPNASASTSGGPVADEIPY